MSKRKSQVERAIEALEVRQADIKHRALLDVDALHQAITLLKTQNVRRAPKKPRVASPASDPRD